MYYNVDRYRYTSSKKGRHRRRWLFLTAVFLVVAGGVVFAVASRAGAGRVRNRATPEADLSNLWAQGLYSEVTSAAQERLARDPADWDALLFYGFATYYRAYYEKDLEQKIPLLDHAIEALRRARLRPDVAAAPQIDAVLGQAYYYKGKFYYDLTVFYLERALEAGVSGEGLYEYLGLAYGGLGDSSRELEYFLLAARDNPSDLMLLSLGKSYLKTGQPREAEESLLRALNKTDDPDIEKESRFRLADIYRERGELLKAESEYRDIIRLDPDSAEAHFQLGELYFALGDSVRARSEWRKTLALDRTHYGARRRYYE